MLSIILIIYAVLGVAFIVALAVAAHKPLPKEFVETENPFVHETRREPIIHFHHSRSQRDLERRRAAKWALN